jgi:4-deoxy-L-threo-5-hexosulose-uronate ketol-isomerase
VEHHARPHPRPSHGGILVFRRPARGEDSPPHGGTSQTRHIVVGNQEAVISPSWSVHSDVGSANYSFVWAMAGENQSFDDMDGFAITQMR